MGQKVNPIGLRVGINRTWDSRWYANREYGERLHEALPIVAGEVVWAARHEMARTVEDALSRRTRCLLFNARASIEMAPKVAALMAQELGRDEAWVAEQTRLYTELAEGYLMV